MRTVRVRHVGPGVTNPNNQGRMLALNEYLHHGVEALPPDSHDRRMDEQNQRCENKFAEMMEHVSSP